LLDDKICDKEALQDELLGKVMTDRPRHAAGGLCVRVRGLMAERFCVASLCCC
jgi:hypothetical protein